MITKATEQQWEEIDAIRESWLARQTERVPHEDIRRAVTDMWSSMNESPPMVLVVPSPMAAVIWTRTLLATLADKTSLRQQLDQQLHRQLDQQLRLQLLQQLGRQVNQQLDQQLRQQLRQQLVRQLDQQLYQQLNQQLGQQLGQQLHQLLGQQLNQQLSEQLDQQLDRQLRQQLNQQLYQQLGPQLDQQLGQKIGLRLGQQLGHQLDQQLGEQLGPQLHQQLNQQLRQNSTTPTYYWSIWIQVWAAWYESARILGVELDTAQYDLLHRWCSCVTFCCPYNGLVVVSERPTEVHWRGQVLHNEHGPAVQFADGLCSVWSLDGLQLDEQIVMRPETQTVEQIDGEDNNDIRQVRMERYGYDRYLVETGATVLDETPNEIEGTHEALMRDHKGQVYLWPTCPSGRVCPPLRVPREITTCEQARTWLAGDKPFRVLART